MEYEDRLAIPTPEGLDLRLDLAGPGSRGTALLIDSLIEGALIIALGLVAAAIDALGGDGVGVAVLAAGSFAVLFGYHLLFEVLGGGRSVGKRAASLRVVAADGSPIGWRASGVRNFIRLIEGLPTLYMLALGSVMATGRNQRLGDLAAGTLVIRDRPDTAAAPAAITAAAAAAGAAPAALGPEAVFGPPVPLAAAEPVAPGADVSAVTADELALVRRFLDRRETLEAGPRAALAAELRDGLAGKVRGAPEQPDAEAFLAWLAAAKAARQ